MLLNIIDIASSTMRAVNKTLVGMSHIRLEDMPEVKKTGVSGFRIMMPGDTFASLVTFQQKAKEGTVKGGIVVFISRFNVETIFGDLGLTNQSDAAEIKDGVSEFCNIVAGAFKTEIVALGYEDLGYEDCGLSLPSTYFGLVNEEVAPNVSSKYSLSFSQGGKGILLVDVFLEENSP